jgi:hypothetical protein
VELTSPIPEAPSTILRKTGQPPLQEAVLEVQPPPLVAGEPVAVEDCPLPPSRQSDSNDENVVTGLLCPVVRTDRPTGCRVRKTFLETAGRSRKPSLNRLLTGVALKQLTKMLTKNKELPGRSRKAVFG